MAPAPITVPANYAKLTTAQQNSFWVKALGEFPGTVSAAWVTSNADLKPYQGDTAVVMYGKLATAYPKATPQQRGSTVYQVWLGAGLAQAVGESAIAGGAATGAVAQGVATGLPSWEGAIGNFIAALSSASTWIRVVKVLAGSVILIVGLAKLTGADQHTAALGKAVKLAPLL
jgi:hypothetical protein